MKRRTNRAICLRTALLLGVAVLVVACSSVVTPTDSPPPLTNFADTFQSMCAWPTDTPLAFAGWATMTELGQVDGTGHPGPNDSVYAYVSRDRITQYGHGGPKIGRGICWTDGKVVSMSAVADDWVLNR